MAAISNKKSSISSKRSQAILSPANVNAIYPEHIRTIEKMIDPSIIHPMFGEVNLQEMLDRCYVSLKVDDEQGKIAGVMICSLCPNIPALPRSEWKSWVEALYGLEELCTRNTLWIHLLLWDPCYYSLFLRPLVQRMFQVRNFMQYLLLVLPPGTNKIGFLDNLGTRVVPKDCSNSKSCQTLYLMQRQDFTTSYKIRRAVEEDNDDLIPLIHKYTEKFEEIYGSYYIAELLTRHKDSGRQIIVAEHHGSAVAVLCLNETVNYEVLNEEFELMPYNGLRKPHPDDPEISVDTLRPSIERFLLAHRVEEELMAIIEKRLSLDTVHNRYSDDQLMHVSITSSEDYSLVFTSASMFVFQDDYDDDQDSYSVVTGEESQKIPHDYRVIIDQNRKQNELDLITKCWEPLANTAAPTIPEFKGEPNAFALEIAACHPDHDAGLKMLFASSFECYPDREYCILSVPSTQPTDSLISYFGRIVPRPTGTFPYELYTLHRNAVLSKMNVVEATRCHENAVKCLLATVPNHYIIQQQFETSMYFKDSQFEAFVLMSENQVVGLAILSEEFGTDYLKTHYNLTAAVNLQSHKTGSHGLLEALVMSPIFRVHTKYFLRELHGLSGYSVLYYKHMSSESACYSTERPLLNIIANLLPILPREQPDYDLQVLREEEYEPAAIICEKQEPFALYISTLPHTNVLRFAVNDKIVIVGSSNTALAFLESLLLLSHNPHQLVAFNNITLLSTLGMTRTKVSDKIRENFLVKKNFMDPRHLDLINLRMYVNVVQARLTRIDRREQYIVLNNNSFLSYDVMFLMTGEQFGKPEKENSGPFAEDPENVFIINHGVDAKNAMLKLKQLNEKYKGPDYLVIIYGHFLQAYSTMNGLLNFGVPGSHMVFIEPFPYSMTKEKEHRHNVSVFNDPEVDQAVLDQIKAQGIAVYSSYYFIDWVYNKEDNMITSAKFESRHEMLELECTAMFCFDHRGIMPRIYRVLNDSGLVFDGRLVIDRHCRTNDPNIYAAGTLTKYSRKYYASHLTHKHFNRVEIGHRLGFQIRNMLLPPKYRNKTPKARWNIHLEKGDSLVPLYEKPIMHYCRLPGGLYYFSVVKPGKRIPLETAISLENYGQVLITGNCKDLDSQGFFRLHLNQFKRVETITCLSKFPIDICNIYLLWGKHEKMLNNLQLRFEMALISDFFEYFKEPWIYAIYHNRFEILQNEMDDLMTSTVGNKGFSLIAELIEMYKQNKWKKLTEEQEESIGEKFSVMSYAKMIEQSVLEFIQQNLDHLPMYAHPVVVKALLEGYNKSPMFSR